MLPLLLLMVLAGTTLSAQDPLKAAPNDYKLDLENQWVRVLRSNRGPHMKAPMHDHLAHAVVYLTDVHERVTAADGKVQEINRKAGEVAWGEAVKHAEENLSEKPMELVMIELKPGAPKSPPIALDPVKLDPKYHSILLENDRIRAIRTVLEPHIKSPMHEHPHYVVVYLTELHTTMKMGDGREVDNPRRAGEVAWRDALKHVTENIGDHTAVEIQVELK